LTQPRRERDAAATWERVARSFFRSPASPSFRVGVAGLGDEERVRAVGGVLRDGVRELGSSGVTGVSVHELGVVCEDRLDRLAGEVPQELDLLVWVNAADEVASLRSEYLLGVFAWATEAPRVLCLSSQELENSKREHLSRALKRMGAVRSLEFQVPPGGSGDSPGRWWRGMLQAAMAREDARRRQRRVPDPT